jgi:hypothetical protein
MSGCVSWILNTAPRERSWLHSNVAGKYGIMIILANKYIRLVTATDFLYEDRLILIKLEWMEDEIVGLACVYAPNISTNRRYL